MNHHHLAPPPASWRGLSFILALGLAANALAGGGPQPGNNLRELVWENPSTGIADGSGMTTGNGMAFGYTGSSVIAINVTTGAEVWETPIQSSASFGSTATPFFDSTTNSVYIASGLGTDGTVYRLDSLTGAPVWPGVDLNVAFVNTIPRVNAAGTLAYFASYPDTFNPADGKLFAIRTSDGGVEWQANDGGYGGYRVEFQGSNVLALIYVAGVPQVRAYDALTGVPQWTSTLTGLDDVFGGFTITNDIAYFSTYDFADSDPNNPASELIGVSANNGAEVLREPSSASSGTPIIINEQARAGVDPRSAFSSGSFFYGQSRTIPIEGNGVEWTYNIGYSMGSAIKFGPDRLAFCGHPDGGQAAFYPQPEGQMALLDNFGNYLDGINVPYCATTPCRSDDMLLVAGGGNLRAYRSVAELIKIQELDGNSSTEDYIVLNNVTGASIDLNGWEIELNEGDGTGYVLALTLPTYALAGGGLVRIGAAVHSPSGQSPDLTVGSIDLPALGTGDTVRGVRLMDPSGNVIDSALFQVGTPATNVAANHAADDTGEQRASRSLQGLAVGEGMRRNTVGVDSNDCSDDFRALSYSLSASDWLHYE